MASKGRAGWGSLQPSGARGAAVAPIRGADPGRTVRTGAAPAAVTAAKTMPARKRPRLSSDKKGTMTTGAAGSSGTDTSTGTSTGTGTGTGAGEQHERSHMVQLGIPADFCAGLSEAQQQELRAHLARVGQPWGVCNKDARLGPHAGLGCGARLLRFYHLAPLVSSLT